MDNNIDILNRDKFVEEVFSVIETLSENRKSCTFSINGEWGSGKSFVLHLLEEKLSSWQNEETVDDKYIVFHYNCWQYDYYEEPLVAIVSALYDEATKKCSLFSPETSQKFKDVWIGTKTSISYITSCVTQRLLGVNFRDMHKEVKNDIEASHDNKEYDNNFSIQTAIVNAKEKLSKIAHDYTVVVVVDELDRCLPEYAIKVLERLHHLFDDIENLIVILAVDKKHLNNTVSQIFGFNSDNSEKDIDSYLAKFINFELQLDNGTVDENYKNKYPEYYSKFIDDNNTIISFDEIISALLDPFEPRKRDKIFEKAELIHNMVFNEKVDISIMLVELLFVSYSFAKKSPVFINKHTFLFEKTGEVFPRFAEIFKTEIVEKACLNVSRYHNGELANYHSFVKDNTSAQLLYYISCHKRFIINYYIEDDKKEIFYKNGKKIQKFYELIDIIK